MEYDRVNKKKKTELLIHKTAWINLKNIHKVEESVKVLVAQSCPTLCDPMDCGPTGSHVHGIFPARILEQVAISFSRRSSQPRDQIWVFHIAGRFFTI